MAVPTGKVKQVSAMLKAIHAQEDAEAAKETCCRGTSSRWKA